MSRLATQGLTRGTTHHRATTHVPERTIPHHTSHSLLISLTLTHPSLYYFPLSSPLPSSPLVMSAPAPRGPLGRKSTPSVGLCDDCGLITTLKYTHQCSLCDDKAQVRYEMEYKRRLLLIAEADYVKAEDRARLLSYSLPAYGRKEAEEGLAADARVDANVAFGVMNSIRRELLLLSSAPPPSTPPAPPLVGIESNPGPPSSSKKAKAPCTHQWSADKVGGDCQLCGVVNNEQRIFVRFAMKEDYLEEGDVDCPIEWRFSCLQEEWDDFFGEFSGGGVELEDLPYNSDKHYWEYLQAFRLPDDGQAPTWDHFTDLEVVTTPKDVELLIRVLHVPRVTPGFLKYMVHCPCEPGDLGRCFCDNYHKCTVGRNLVAGAECDEEEEEEGEEEEEEEKKERKVELCKDCADAHCELCGGVYPLDKDGECECCANEAIPASIAEWRERAEKKRKTPPAPRLEEKKERSVPKKEGKKKRKKPEVEEVESASL